MKPNHFNPIWDSYLAHQDVDVLRQDVLTTPWYRRPTKTTESLLQRAIEIGDFPAVKTLVELGESPALPADDGFTLLHSAVDMACENEESQAAIQIVQCLLENGGDPNLHGIDGATPLHRAAGSGLAAVVETMLQHNGDIESRTLTDGELTPLMYAAMMGQSPIVQLLLTQGADTSARCAEYRGRLTAAELVEQKNPKNASATLSILRG